MIQIILPFSFERERTLQKSCFNINLSVKFAVGMSIPIQKKTSNVSPKKVYVLLSRIERIKPY